MHPFFPLPLLPTPKERRVRLEHRVTARVFLVKGESSSRIPWTDLCRFPGGSVGWCRAPSDPACWWFGAREHWPRL